jgi:hypothetical protein
MASLSTLRGFICPPRLFTTGASIVVMLNGHYSRRSVGATPELGPLGIQLILDLNRDYLISGWTKPELGANPGRCLLLVE